MFKDDDDDEENTFGVTRYPCMPSLVALQQMRNRLHLAHLGRKLMKWTALATGRELRRIAIELDADSKGLSEDMRGAFILLARSRFFCPELNKIVTENIGHQASVAVASKSITVSAVKIVQFEILETGIPAYPHLGIEKGGQAIMEAKKEWLKLLKKLILMMQLRTSFIMVDLANKSATKRLNVVKKIVIPRTTATSTYILSELEELAREEFSRLKKIKEKKRVKKKHVHVENRSCPICDKQDEKTKTGTEDTYSGYILEAKQPESVDVTDKPFVQSAPVPEVTLASASTGDTSGDVTSVLIILRKRLPNIIQISKNFIEAGIDSFNVNDFLNICERAKNRLEKFSEVEPSSSQLGSDLKDQLDNLKCNLRDVIDVTKAIKKEDSISSSIDKFINACKVVDCKLNETQPKSDNEKSKTEVNEFTTHIDGVMQMTTDYTSEGLLTIGVEEFLRSCSIIKAKIEGKPISTTDKKDANEEKLNDLKDHISELEQLTTTIEEKKVSSTNIEKFVSACKEFKSQLEKDREKLQEKLAIKELSENIDKTVGVGKEAEKEGLLGESIENFMRSLGDVKKRINPEEHAKVTESHEEPTVLDALKSQINNMIKSVSKIKSTNLKSVSVDNLLQSCEIAKAKLEVYEKYSPVTLEKRMIYPDCSETCVCGRQNASTEECEKCQKMGNEVSYYDEGPAPCDYCKNTKIEEIEEIPSDQAVCGVCSRPYEEDFLLPEPSPNLSPEESDLCEVCEMLKKEQEAESKPDEQPTKEEVPPTVDSSLGYFEKKIRKITKVKRTQNPDGTIREEKKTITVKQEKHDPNETTLLEDDENEEYDVSYDSLEDEDDKQVAVCTTPNQNQRGFMYWNNKAKSEIIFRASPMAIPVIKHCISHGCIDSKDNNSIANDSSSIELESCSLYSNSNTLHQNRTASNN